jgi:hypothetical protein
MKRYAMVLCLSALTALAVTADAGVKTDSALITAKDRALVWLKQQKVPNAVIPDPQPERRNLVVSYEIPQEHPAYKYIFGRSVIYDDALAAIAFTMNKDYKTAAQILLALRRLQHKDGSLWFGYNVNNDWPSETDFEGSTERSGASAWVGYAAVYYVRTRLAEDPSALQKGDVQMVLELARSLGTYLLGIQVLKKGDLRYGLVTGGRNSFELKLEEHGADEIFRAGSIDWISTEHNIDAFFFMRDLGAVTKNTSYSESAELIRTSMMRLWSEKHRQFIRGLKKTNPDPVLALDCASWGSVFSFAAGKNEYAAQSLAVLEKLYASGAQFNGSAAVRGYKPYADREIYEDANGPQIARFYFPDLKGTTWDLIDGVWVEGTMGAALAYLKAGRRDRAEEILRNVLPLQSRSGGFIYFTREVPHEFSTFVSVASTAWFIMMACALENPQTADLFWGR